MIRYSLKIIGFRTFYTSIAYIKLNNFVNVHIQCKTSFVSKIKNKSTFFSLKDIIYIKGRAAHTKEKSFVQILLCQKVVKVGVI